jgi:SAM-dependent methyltransferase
MAFQDHFSGHAASYAAHRPTYPGAMFDWLASLAPDHQEMWDCGTGNGQAAVALAKHFARVRATDASARQIAEAQPHPRVTYSVAPAEASGLGDESVSLVTVAQAVHWFDLPRFWEDVRRVSKPQGVVAIWCYQLTRVAPEIDAIVLDFYREIVGPFWPPERALVENGYREIDFPFVEIEPPPFDMTADWTCGQLAGYLRTWSASRRYQEANAEDPVALIEPQLRTLWGGDTRRVAWPLAMRVGRVQSKLAARG